MGIAIHWPSRALWAPPGQCPVPVVIHYFEHTLQLWFYKLSLGMRHHGSTSTPGPGPSRSRFGVQNDDLPPLNWGHTETFVYKVLPKCTPVAPDSPHTPFLHPVPAGVGGTGPKKPRTFPPLRTTSVPNFIAIHQVVWISTENKHTDRKTLPFSY